MLWLAYRMTGDEDLRELARLWSTRLQRRAKLETAFKGFGFYVGAALGHVLGGDSTAHRIALEAADSLRRQFDRRLGLIPLGRDAEEAGDIDSLQASPLLFWAERETHDAAYAECAASHTSRVLDIHCRGDGSIIQSSELDSATGRVLRHFTHKGFSDTSIWGRAQAWGLMYSATSVARRPKETRWLDQSMRAADWWLAHVPGDMVAFWDFDDPAIPDTQRDTAATSIACAGLLKLAEVAPASHRPRYREAAERTARALIRGYLTPVAPGDARPTGMLVGGCFNKRPDSRAKDAATNAELIFGSYYLFASLLALRGAVSAIDI
jgi:unsaturated chondroitin disaccharide hydrolase